MCTDKPEAPPKIAHQLTADSKRTRGRQKETWRGSVNKRTGNCPGTT